MVINQAFVVLNLGGLIMIVTGARAGWFSRTWWQAALAGLVIGAIAGVAANYLVHGQGMALVADPLGTTIWTLAVYGLKTILVTRKARHALSANSN